MLPCMDSKELRASQAAIRAAALAAEPTPFPCLHEPPCRDARHHRARVDAASLFGAWVPTTDEQRETERKMARGDAP